ENVEQYMDNSFISIRLRELIPDDPQESSANCGMGTEIVRAWRRSRKNIAHAVAHGCFCFGVVYIERGHYRSGDAGGRTVVMRYNQWATDNAPIYAMIRKPRADKSVPRQASSLAHYRSALL
ncbi:unnamed protein product, partial [Prorocentrum cordatum]